MSTIAGRRLIWPPLCRGVRPVRHIVNAVSVVARRWIPFMVMLALLAVVIGLTFALRIAIWFAFFRP